MNRRKFFGLFAALPVVPLAACLPAVAAPEVITVLPRADGWGPFEDMHDITWEGMSPSQINESCRQMMGTFARWRDDARP